MKFKSKQFVRKLLSRRKVRLGLWILFIPISFTVIATHRIFDYEWYKSQFVGKQKWIKNSSRALLHYLLHGRRRGLTPNPFFVPEYFDSQNWQGSIIDPLTRYLVEKKNWSLPTSIIFNPQNETVTHQALRAPLVSFLRQINHETFIVFDVNCSEPKEWGVLKPELYAANRNYQQQEELRSLSSPVYTFDYELEKETIEKYNKLKPVTHKKTIPLVSIIMPVWNRQELVVEAIRSVQAQTFQDWELVITDDGSTDKSVKVITELQKSDKRIVLSQPGHAGVCKARNNSLELSNGKWIAFLDSDNTWTSDYLQTMVAFMTDQKSSAAYSAIKMENNGQIRYRTTQPNAELLKVANYIDLNALVVSRSTLEETGFFDESLRRMVDYDLVCRISKKTALAYVPIIGVLYTDHEDASRITTTELASWDGVIKSKNYIDWEAALKKRDNKVVSVIVPVRNDIRTALRSIKALTNEIAGRDDVELVVVDSSSTSAVNSTLSGLQASTPGYSIVMTRAPGSHDNTLGANYGFVSSSGETVVFVDQRAIVEPHFLDPLVESVHANGGIVGPVQLKTSRVVHSAGEIFSDDGITPVHLLENHPLSDLKDLDDSYEVPALSAGCFAINADMFAQLKGFNPLYDKGFETQDICLRAKDSGISSYISKQATISNLDGNKGWHSTSQKTFYSEWSGKIPKKAGQNLWSKAGFELIEYVRENKQGEYGQLTPKVRSKNKTGHRWAIKISAPADERRFAWGDMYYAQALAAALERLGQRVAIDYHGFHHRPTSYLDDVLLDLRGLDDTKPQKDAINIMWVISHPEKVTPEIVRSFDEVYAAGGKWAEYMSDESGKKVEFLPQCTDPNVFHLTEVDQEFAGKVLFVGNSRNVLRPIVRDAIAADMDVAVYGGGWEGLIDKKYIKGTFIPNDKLANAYSSAEIVLNDHWADMRDWGFISNRLFDAAASGATIISDNVAPLDDIFKGLVATYNSDENLADIVHRHSFPKASECEDIAKCIAKDHSFDARARLLIDRANE